MSEDKHIEVQVLAPAKGSNPGVIGTIGPRKYHIKYCNRSNIKGTPLTVAHQPIYEALTAELARMLGLKTPNCGVLQDKGNLSFVKMPVYDGQIPAGREFYFTSELVRPTDVDIDQSEIEKMLAQEEIYNKFLMIGDNSGSKGNRDNFVLVGKDPKICYVDFGCSYVHCVGGAMTLKNAVKKMRLDKRQLTRNRKTLGQRVLEDNKGVFGRSWGFTI